MSKEVTQITVAQLKKYVDQEIAKGNGNRKIVISDDTEGNGYHGLFFAFTTIDQQDKEWYPIYDSQSDDINEIIILG